MDIYIEQLGICGMPINIPGAALKDNLTLYNKTLVCTGRNNITGKDLVHMKTYIPIGSHYIRI